MGANPESTVVKLPIDHTTDEEEILSSSTKVIDGDFLADVPDEEHPPREVTDEHLQEMLWEAVPELYQVLQGAADLEAARDRMYEYLGRCERRLFDVDNADHVLEKAVQRDCITVLRTVMAPVNEKRTKFSALDILWKLATGRQAEIVQAVSVGFLMEFYHLFHGIAGTSQLYRETERIRKGIPGFLRLTGREAAIERTDMLDEQGESVYKVFRRYPSGLENEVIGWRERNRQRILRYFGGSDDDWYDYRWHLKHVITKASTLLDLIEVTPEREAALKTANEIRLPFGITPYYVSLMDRTPSVGFDHAVRAQVLPPPDYVDEMAAHMEDRKQAFDFMGEHDTSPIGLVTRRYPMICILKPYNTCAQICVYCQRNWEIDQCMAPDALSSWENISSAIDWIAEHPAVGDVLLTGGDPLIMSDRVLDKILSRVAQIDHVYRIRIGSRTPVVLPQRITDTLCEMLAKYHKPGRREIALVTHFEHSYEITPEARDAVRKVRRLGIGVYNQQVFTIENSRRFETCKLRRDLRSIGVDPYYTFNMKGKRELWRYMAPIARLLQERKEEARVLPGLDRTDEPVFNVPRMGKNHLRARQDHNVIMILADGARVYEFHPWEKMIHPMPAFKYVDRPIYEYLQELAERGESVRDYRTIWYYF